jgi:hypothetical protein
LWFENRKSRADPQRHFGDPSGTVAATKNGVHATFFQKVLICAFAAFLAASLVEWAKVFVEGADDALNKGYKHHSVMDSSK